MALSPADFAAYSRATGAPYPESPEERAEMVPEVRAFRQNQLQRSDNQGSDTLALGIGLGLGLAGLGAGALKLRGRGKGQPKKDTAGKSSVKMTDLSDQQASDLVETALLPEQTKAGVYERVKRKFPDVPGEQELTRAYAPEAQRAEAHAEKFGYADLNPAERKLTNLETGEIYSRGRSPDVPLDLLTRFNNELEELGLDKITRGEAGEMLAGPEVAAETRQMTGTESSRQSAAVRRMEREEESLAKNILSELADETPTLTETYEAFGEPAAQMQNIDAVDTASDQIDSRFESTVQRDVDSVFEGKSAVAAEKLSVYGPLSAEDTVALARDQMIALRAELEAKGLRPGSTRFERALAERFKTGETTKIGELGTTGRSLQQVGLPSGPIRQTVQSVETSQSPTFSTRSVANVGGDLSSDVTEAASGTSIRGRSRIQNQPEQFRQRVDSSGRRIDDEFGVELTELDLDTGESRFSRQVVDPITGKLTLEYAPKGQRAVQLFQGEGQPTKTMYIPESDPGGIGIYGEERSFASGPIVKVDPSMEIDPATKRPIPTDKPKAGQYTKTAQRKPTDLPYPQKKGGDLTDMSTEQLQTFASNAVKKNPRAAQAAMSELERREVSKRSMQASEAIRRANIEGRDHQKVLRSMGFGV